MSYMSDISHTSATELAPVTSIPNQENPSLVYLASLSPGSRRTMRQALDAMAALLTSGRCDHRTLPWGMLRFQHTQALRAILLENYAAATANKMLSALRQTIKMAWSLGYMSADEFQRATDLKAVKGETPDAAAGRALGYEEWLGLFMACQSDAGPAGVRDAAIIALMKIAGLRRAEVATLQLENFNQETKTLTVKGKRNKTRSVPIEDKGAIDALSDWLYLRGGAPGALFTRIRKGGVILVDQLSDQAIYSILQKRGEEAGLASFTPHDTRRTFAGDLLDAGVDLVTVQKLMGHSDANTTAGYDRSGEVAKRSAVKKLHVPYKRRFVPGSSGMR